MFAKKEQYCQNNPENSYTEKKAKHKLSGYSLSLICSFDETKNRRKFYREKHCIEKFKEDLKELAKEIINFYYDKNKKSEYALYHRVRDHCHFTGKFRGVAHSICNLRYKVPKKIPIVFHNVSTYDYHFIIKQSAEDFKGQFECLGENTEKHITFSVPIKEDDNSKKITCKLKFIDSYRVMNNKLSALLITYLKLTKRNVRNAGENVNLSDLKKIDYIINTKNAEKDVLSQKTD